MLKRATFLTLCAIAIGGAHAAPLYTTGDFDPELAFASDSVPGQFNDQRLAEAFVLTSTSSISDIQWWGRSEGSVFHDLRNFNTFTVDIYSDAGAIPGASLFTATFAITDASPTLIGTDSSNNELYRFDLNTSGLTLERGTYWFSVGTANDDPNGDGFYWLASQTRISGNFAADGGVDGDWNGSGFADLAMTVNGQPVPEPATMAILGAGLVTILRRRAKKS